MILNNNNFKNMRYKALVKRNNTNGMQYKNNFNSLDQRG